jgi:ABC-type nickel/cobalt efflux system permease component RcnA
MSYAIARGLLGAGLAVTAAMAVGMIATIGGFAVAAASMRERLMSLLEKTERCRQRLGSFLEVGSSVMVFLLGVALVLRSAFA